MNKTENKSQVVLELLKAAECLDLAAVANVVKSHCGALIPLVKLTDYEIRVCGQEGTVYADEEMDMEALKADYLPERMEMEVIGVIDEFGEEERQMIFLLCEDGNVYAYIDWEFELHLVARSLKELFENGMPYPGIQIYMVKPLTKERYDAVMADPKVKEFHEQCRKLCEESDAKALKAIKSLQEFLQMKTAQEPGSQDERLEDQAVQSVKSLNITF